MKELQQGIQKLLLQEKATSVSEKATVVSEPKIKRIRNKSHDSEKHPKKFGVASTSQLVKVRLRKKSACAVYALTNFLCSTFGYLHLDTIFICIFF